MHRMPRVHRTLRRRRRRRQPLGRTRKAQQGMRLFKDDPSRQCHGPQQVFEVQRFLLFPILLGAVDRPTNQKRRQKSSHQSEARTKIVPPIRHEEGWPHQWEVSTESHIERFNVLDRLLYKPTELRRFSNHETHCGEKKIRRTLRTPYEE